jgi:6-phosphogluconate dehydrogenase
MNNGQAVIGVVGLGVVGHSLALNIERNGFKVGAYNRDPTVRAKF